MNFVAPGIEPKGKPEAGFEEVIGVDRATLNYNERGSPERSKDGKNTHMSFSPTRIKKADTQNHMDPRAMFRETKQFLRSERIQKY